jgi:hypothetical protein
MTVAVSLALVLAIVGAWFAIGRLAATVATTETDDFDASRLETYNNLKVVLVTWGLFVPPLLTAGVVTGLLGDGLPTVAAAAGDAVLGVLASTATLFALARGQRPLATVTRDAALTTPAWFDRVRLASVVVPAALFAVPYTFVASGIPRVPLYWGFAALPFAFVARHAFSTLAGPGSNATADPTVVRDATPAERDRLERATERLGYDPGWIQVVDRGEDALPHVDAAGFRSRRTIVVRESALDAWDDDALAVAIAAVAERERRGFLAARMGWLSAIALLFVAAGDMMLFQGTGLLSFTGELALAGLAVGLLVCFAWLCRRAVLGGDAFARERFGTPTVTTVYEVAGAGIGKNPARGVPAEGVPVLGGLSTLVSPFPFAQSRMNVLGRTGDDGTDSPAD